MKRFILATILAVGLAVAGIAPSWAAGWEIQQNEKSSRWRENNSGEKMPLGETSGIPFVFSTLSTASTVYAVSPKTGYVVRAFYVTGSAAAGSNGTANTVDFWIEGITNGAPNNTFVKITGMFFRIQPNTATASNDTIEQVGLNGETYHDSAFVNKGQVIAVHSGGGGTGATPTIIQVVVE